MHVTYDLLSGDLRHEAHPQRKMFWNSQPSSLSPHILGSWPALIGEKEENQTSHCCFQSSVQQSLCRGRSQSTRSDYLLITISACRTSLFPLVTANNYYTTCFWNLTTIFFSGISHFFYRPLHTYTQTHKHTRTNTHTLYPDIPDSRWPKWSLETAQFCQHSILVSQGPYFLPSLIPTSWTHPLKPIFLAECQSLKLKEREGGGWIFPPIIFSKCLIPN